MTPWRPLSVIMMTIMWPVVSFNSFLWSISRTSNCCCYKGLCAALTSPFYTLSLRHLHTSAVWSEHLIKLFLTSLSSAVCINQPMDRLRASWCKQVQRNTFLHMACCELHNYTLTCNVLRYEIGFCIDATCYMSSLAYPEGNNPQRAICYSTWSQISLSIEGLVPQMNLQKAWYHKTNNSYLVKCASLLFSTS